MWFPCPAKSNEISEEHCENKVLCEPWSWSWACWEGLPVPWVCSGVERGSLDVKLVWLIFPHLFCWQMQQKLKIILEGGSIKLTILARSLLFTCTCLHLWSIGFCCKRSCRQSSCRVNHWMQQGRDGKVTHGFQLISFLVSCYFPSPNCS